MKNNQSISAENLQNDKRMYFRTSGGVTLQATLAEFNRNWKDYVLSRGETYIAEPIEDDDYLLKTIDAIMPDRNGKEFSVWYIYRHGRIVSIQYTKGGLASNVERVEFFKVAA
jgi:hypothetical protein